MSRFYFSGIYELEKAAGGCQGSGKETWKCRGQYTSSYLENNLPQMAWGNKSTLFYADKLTFFSTFHTVVLMITIS